MRKNVLVTLIILLPFPFYSLAASVKNGVLQAYWLPSWKGDVNEPELALRFFVFSDEGKQQEVINIDPRSFREVFIKSSFKKTADDFLKSKEGHIEQVGRISLADVTYANECDSKIWRAKVIEFKVMKNNLKLDESKNECNGLPYLLTYQLKEGVKKIDILERPDISAIKIGIVGGQHTLVKIKTINPEWFYVAVYDASKQDFIGWPKGYARKKDLSPVN